MFLKKPKKHAKIVLYVLLETFLCVLIVNTPCILYTVGYICYVDYCINFTKNIHFSIQCQILSNEEMVIWPSAYPRKANLSDVLAIDMEFIGLVDAANGHLGTYDTPYEVAIVDANLNTVFHSRCRPKTLPKLGRLRSIDWKRKYTSQSLEYFLKNRNSIKSAF